MKNRMTGVGMLVAALGVLSAGDASAEILSATASGPGGTVTNIVIDTAIVTNDAISSMRTTRRGPDHLQSDRQRPRGVLHRLSHWVAHRLHRQPLSLVLYLPGECPERLGDERSRLQFLRFPQRDVHPRHQSDEHNVRRPARARGRGTTDIYTAVNIPGSASGTQTFQVVWTPTLQSVPEPSTLVLGLTGAMVGLGYLAAHRRARRRA